MSSFTTQSGPRQARTVAVALLGVVPIAVFVQWSDIRVGGTMAAGPFPPLAGCIAWALLVGVTWLFSRVRRSAPVFRRDELLVILAAWLTANMVAGRGMLHPFLASLVGPTYYARSGVVKAAVAANLPSWLAVTDRTAASRFFEGSGNSVPWRVWERPLTVWALFFLPFLVANICLCGLFERVWVRNERLAFPLVALPLEAFGRNARRSRVFKRTVAIGLMFPILLHGLGAAHAYLPAVPCVPFFNDVSDFVTDPPWTALRPLYVNIYPLLIGVTFLAPTDATFSIWFFLLLNKVEMLITAAAGWNDGALASGMAQPPYIEEQSAGAYLALAALFAWNARAPLGMIARSWPAEVRMWVSRLAARAPLPESRLDAPAGLRDPVSGAACKAAAGMRRGAGPGGGLAAVSDRPLQSAGRGRREAPSGGDRDVLRTGRAMMAGFVLGFAGVLAWCVRTGLPLWFAAGFFGFYFVVALVLSRLMAESGIVWILAPILPDKLLLSLAGVSAVSQTTITRLMLYVQHLRDTRQMLGPAVTQAGKVRDAACFPARRFYLLLLGSVLLALCVGGAVALPMFYRYGALASAPNSDGLMMSVGVVQTTAIGQASTRLMSPVQPSTGAAVAVAAGAAVTWTLGLLRMRFPGWPLHPLGYALTGTLQIGYANKMLFSVFLGWAFKSLALRLGGARGFRLLRGVALGLILGDLLMGAILKLLDACLGPSGYAIF